MWNPPMGGSGMRPGMPPRGPGYMMGSGGGPPGPHYPMPPGPRQPQRMRHMGPDHRGMFRPRFPGTPPPQVGSPTQTTLIEVI